MIFTGGDGYSQFLYPDIFLFPFLWRSASFLADRYRPLPHPTWFSAFRLCSATECGQSPGRRNHQGWCNYFLHFSTPVVLTVAVFLHGSGETLSALASSGPDAEVIDFHTVSSSWAPHHLLSAPSFQPTPLYLVSFFNSVQLNSFPCAICFLPGS